jgi:hypothetical protein
MAVKRRGEEAEIRGFGARTTKEYLVRATDKALCFSSVRITYLQSPSEDAFAPSRSSLATCRLLSRSEMRLCRSH